eukprot:8082631-Lingulodinium_polyedra.AAC.1
MQATLRHAPLHGLPTPLLQCASGGSQRIERCCVRSDAQKGIAEARGCVVISLSRVCRVQVGQTRAGE